MRAETTITLDMPGGLAITAALDPQAPILTEFYAGYEKAFVLPNEREELEGFENCLALNLPPLADSLTRRYGPFREVVLVARERAGGPMIGGANFIAFPPPAALPDRSAPAATINLNYVFVVEAARGKGHLRRLADSVTPTARHMLGLAEGVPVLTFIEQNDPLRMSVADYVEDTRLTGLDQVDRIGIWAKLGARVVDFPYVQPPLSAEHAPEESLVYSVLGAAAAQLSPCLLEHHLRRFFAISVFKDGDPEKDKSAGGQLAALAELCKSGRKIALRDPSAWVAGAGVAIRHKGRAANSPPSLRDALRAI